MITFISFIESAALFVAKKGIYPISWSATRDHNTYRDQFRFPVILLDFTCPKLAHIVIGYGYGAPLAVTSYTGARK